MENDGKLTRKDNILLIEYQKAQDSAEHHDKLIWVVSSIIIGGMLILVGQLLGFLENQNLKSLVIVTSFLGIVLSVSLQIFQSNFSSIKNYKYERCIKIEKKYGMKQHSGLPQQNRFQTNLYFVIVVLFIIIWTFVLSFVLLK